MAENGYFNKALQDFAFDAASGDAIRHLADKGMSVSEIMANLTFPTPVERVRNTVWKHLVDTGIISLCDPAMKKPSQVTFVKEYTSTGRATFRMVAKENNKGESKYYPCDFGRRKYQDKDAYEKMLNALEKQDRDYLKGLPWPIETVYHIADERMERIMNIITDLRGADIEG